MPLFDVECSDCGAVTDRLFRRYEDPNPPCEACGGTSTRKLMGRFAVPFSGSLSKYMNPNKEGGDREGFWATRKLSSVSGNPEPVFLETVQQVREFNAAEGLSAPGDVPTNATISADGKEIKSDGMPGQWRAGGSIEALVPSRVWQMDNSLTSLRGKDPAPQSSGPPCTVQAVDPGMMSKFAAEAAG